jgi:hypothetical protein
MSRFPDEAQKVDRRSPHVKAWKSKTHSHVNWRQYRFRLVQWPYDSQKSRISRNLGVNYSLSGFLSKWDSMACLFLNSADHWVLIERSSLQSDFFRLKSAGSPRYFLLERKTYFRLLFTTDPRGINRTDCSRAIGSGPVTGLSHAAPYWCGSSAYADDSRTAEWFVATCAGIETYASVARACMVRLATALWQVRLCSPLWILHKYSFVQELTRLPASIPAEDEIRFSASRILI